MSEEFERVQQIDAPGVVRAVADAGGPRLELVRRLSGGAVGAWLVRRDDGRERVLTWSPPSRAGQPADRLGRSIEMMNLAASAGVPIPRYDMVVALADGGAAILQERVVGITPERVSETLVDELLAIADCRRGLALGSRFEGEPMPLHLHSDGPGFCLHAPLRTAGPSTAALLESIERTVRPEDDALLGLDVVHFDFHIGNVLVDPNAPDRVVAIVDWGGAAPGQVELDLAMLAFDLTWRAPGAPQQRVERHLVETADDDVFAKVWAHASLRLLDFTVRHFPADIDHWIGVVRRHVS